MDTPEAQRVRRGPTLRNGPLCASLSAAALTVLGAAGEAPAAASEPLSLPAALTATSAALLVVALGLGIAYVRVRRHERAAREAVRVPDTYRAAPDGLAASEAAR